MRNIFLEKSCTKCEGETSPDPYLKNQIWASLDQQLEILCRCFYYMSNSKTTSIGADDLLLPHVKFLKKNKKEVWNEFPGLNLCMIFEEEYFSHCILLSDETSFSGCLYFLKYWAISAL